MTDETEARRKREADDLIARTMRAMIDMTVEQKRAVVEQLDKLVALEESSFVAAERLQ